MVMDIEAQGGSAVGHLVNLVEPGAIETLAAEAEKMGPVQVVVFNLGAQIGSKALSDTSLKQFELGWRMACLGLFRAAQALVPFMLQRGQGCFLVTSSTAALRGNAGQHSHAAAMGGRRMLCQSLNAELAPCLGPPTTTRHRQAGHPRGAHRRGRHGGRARHPGPHAGCGELL